MRGVCDTRFLGASNRLLTVNHLANFTLALQARRREAFRMPNPGSSDPDR